MENILYVGNHGEWLDGNTEAGITYLAADGGLMLNNSMNRVIKAASGCGYIMYEAECFADSPGGFARAAVRIGEVTGTECIVYAPGYLKTSELVVACLAAGIHYFILSSVPATRLDQLGKCVNGYYKLFHEEEFGSAGQRSDEHPCKMIGIAGSCARIGTTTLARQLQKYLESCGRRAAYCTYRDRDKVPLVNVEFLVTDYGDMGSRSFVQQDFLSQDRKAILCGVSPSEKEYTAKAVSSPYYKDARLVFNFTGSRDREDTVPELTAGFPSEPLFLGWCPDPEDLSGNQGDLNTYHEISGVEKPQKASGKRGLFFGRKKKKK